MTARQGSSLIELSIVVPAYNEAANLPTVVDDIVATLEPALRGRYEIVIVDDGGADGTGEVAENLARRRANIVVCRHERNQGLGAALRTGFQRTSGNYVTFLPADGEVEADQALNLYREIGDADVMTSSRLARLEETNERRPLYRDFLTWGFQRLNCLVLGFNPAQNSGIYMLRGPLLRSFELQSKTGFIGLEIFLHCLESGAKRRHGTMTWRKRLSGSSKVATLSGVFKLLVELFRIRRYVRQAHRKAAPLRRAA